MSNKKEDRSEHLFFSCTPQFKKDFDMLGDNNKMKEQMIRNFFTTELDWIKENCDEVDEHIVLYRAKLVKIKDEYNKHQDLYIEEIEKIIKALNDRVDPIKTLCNNIDDRVEYINSRVLRITDSLERLPLERLERFNNAIDKFNSFTTAEKDIIKLLIDSE